MRLSRHTEAWLNGRTGLQREEHDQRERGPRCACGRTATMFKATAARLAMRAAMVTFIAALAGCGADGTPPSTSGLVGHIPSSILYPPICRPEGPNVRCSVKYYGRGADGDVLSNDDITSRALWSVSASPYVVQPTTAAAVAGPGFIVPRDGGNISIDATYNGQRSRALPRFAVAPGRDAIVLATALGGWAGNESRDRRCRDRDPGWPLCRTDPGNERQWLFCVRLLPDGRAVHDPRVKGGV